MKANKIPSLKVDHQTVSFFAMTPFEAMETLKTSRQGISFDEADLRLKRDGANELPRRGDVPWWKVFLRQFHNPLIYILLAAALLKFYIKGPVDATVIACVVLLMTGLGFFQEMRAQKAMSSLLNLIAPKAKLRREGRPAIVSCRDIVAGDILILDAGDRVAADARLIEVSHLTVAESALTGESIPIEKRINELNKNTVLSERSNMVFMGTVITAGRALAVVTATGGGTEIGRIAQSIAQSKPQETPLQRSIARLGNLMLKIVAVAAVFIFVIGFWQGMEIKELIVLMIAAAVSAIPEGLPAAVTVVLAVGMQYMARRNAIIRKLLAVETLGASTVICTDKTGTLTLNQMTVRQIFTDGQLFDVSQLSSLTGGVRNPLLEQTLRLGVLCNDSSLVNENGKVVVAGDPTEGALLSVAFEFGIHKEAQEEIFPRLGDIPFNSQRKWMATLHQEEGHQTVYVKGALEKLLQMSAYVSTREGVVLLDQKHREEWQRVHDQMADQAMRVLAVGYSPYLQENDDLQENSIKGKMILCGMFAMIDPPRPETIKAVADCRRAGLRVIMITGDNVKTAAAIGKEIGLDYKEVLTGTEVANLDDQRLKQKVKTVSIFARIDPLDKLRIVTALQDNGSVVAMTGDGVNDAPALEKADIGVSMGITGTDVAKEASDMVLSDDNFASILAAIEEGRAIFNRLRNVTAFLMTTCLGELFTLILALIFLGIPPLEPIQILWINLVTGALVAIPLGMEPKTGQELLSRPRRKETGLIYRGMLYRIVFLSALLAISVFIVFRWCVEHMPVEEARTVAFSAIVIFEWLLAFNFRSDTRTAFELGFLKNKWLVLALLIGVLLHLMINYVPVIHTWFYVVPMKSFEWGLALIPGIVVFILEDLRKRFFYKLFEAGK